MLNADHSSFENGNARNFEGRVSAFGSTATPQQSTQRRASKEHMLSIPSWASVSPRSLTSSISFAAIELHLSQHNSAGSWPVWDASPCSSAASGGCHRCGSSASSSLNVTMEIAAGWIEVARSMCTIRCPARGRTWWCRSTAPGVKITLLGCNASSVRSTQRCRSQKGEMNPRTVAGGIGPKNHKSQILIWSCPPVHYRSATTALWGSW